MVTLGLHRQGENWRTVGLWLVLIDLLLRDIVDVGWLKMLMLDIAAAILGLELGLHVCVQSPSQS